MSPNADKQTGKCACGAIVERPRGAGRFATLLDAQPFVCESCKEPQEWHFRDRVIPGSAHAQLHTGASFGLDAPDHVPSVWGHGADVPWGHGESLLICGPQGVGKSSVMQQLALRRCGVLKGDLLGFPVERDRRVSLYLALDRPAQIGRSIKRMVTEEHRKQLELGFITWRGALPFNLVERPDNLYEFVREIGELLAPVGTVFIDSVKDLAAGLASDEVGAAVNRALGQLVANDIEVCATHHGRKATDANKRPNTLADIYGSVWITAGAGSVILLWGDAGDPIVELTHLKQPAEDVGPFEVLHDHPHGTCTRRDRPDAWTVLMDDPDGITAKAAAETVYGATPDKPQVERVRRRFDRFVSEGHATKIEPPRTFSEASSPTFSTSPA